MRNRSLVAGCLLVLVACGGSAPAPVPAPEPAPVTPAPAPARADERVIGTVRVNVSTLNVRSEASASAAVIGRVRRGERLTLISESGDWLRVRLNDGTTGGTTGFVSAQHVVRDGAASRPRRSGCRPDSVYMFVNTPKPSFSEGGPHGMVVIEATVDASGNVTATRLVSNETGEASLAALAEREISGARFAPPIRNCVPRAFIFTYKRAF